MEIESSISPSHDIDVASLLCSICLKTFFSLLYGIMLAIVATIHSDLIDVIILMKVYKSSKLLHIHISFGKYACKEKIFFIGIVGKGKYFVGILMRDNNQIL